MALALKDMGIHASAATRWATFFDTNNKYLGYNKKEH
jgi:hypothetical protein